MSIFNQGYLTGLNGGLISNCPFDDETEESKQWKAGFYDGKEAYEFITSV